MKNNMLSKEVVEKLEFNNQAGMIDVYACGCGITKVYLFHCSGLVPTMLTCACGGQMFSHMSSVTQPSCLWYRPKDEAELKSLAQAAYAHGILHGLYLDTDRDTAIAIISENYIAHYNKGGLFAAPMIR